MRQPHKSGGSVCATTGHARAADATISAIRTRRPHLISLLDALPETGFNQLRPDAMALEPRCHRHWRKRGHGNRRTRRFNSDRTEKNVADPNIVRKREQ